MTILQVCAFSAPNGGNFIASLEYLELKLKERSIETIYAFADGAKEKPWCREIQARTKVYFLPTANARILPKTYQIFKQIYRENRIAIMHSHFELYDMPATIMAPKETKIFWHLHDALKRNYQNGSTSRKILTHIQYGLCGKRATLLSVSEEHAFFVEKLGFPKKQIFYFPNGINIDRIKQTPLIKTNNQFLMFGWEIIRKGVDLVVNAAKKLSASNIEIVIVGQEECQMYLEKHCSNYKTVFFHPPVENINDLYCKTKAFLHVSRAEGLSYALLEVIYAGIPVICSDIPENQFAKAFRNVKFVNNEDDDSIAQQIEAISFQPYIISEEDMEFNRALIEKEYSIDAWAQKLINLYDGF